MRRSVRGLATSEAGVYTVTRSEGSGAAAGSLARRPPASSRRARALARARPGGEEVVRRAAPGAAAALRENTPRAARAPLNTAHCLFLMRPYYCLGALRASPLAQHRRPASTQPSVRAAPPRPPPPAFSPSHGLSEARVAFEAGGGRGRGPRFVRRVFRGAPCASDSPARCARARPAPPGPRQRAPAARGRRRAASRAGPQRVKTHARRAIRGRPRPRGRAAVAPGLSPHYGPACSPATPLPRTSLAARPRLARRRPPRPSCCMSRPAATRARRPRAWCACARARRSAAPHLWPGPPKALPSVAQWRSPPAARRAPAAGPR